MSCRDVDRLIQLYVDRELDAPGVQRLREHVAGCAACRRNLQEMVALVNTLEEIRSHVRMRSAPASLIWLKRAAACLAIAVLIYLAPFGTLPWFADEPQMAVNRGETDISRELPEATHKVMVFATQGETLHIPQGDYIHVVSPNQFNPESGTDTAWIYPSAIPFFLEDGSSWYTRVKRLVFVRVPDDHTFKTLMSTVGIGLDQGAEQLRNTAFPTSVIITLGKEPKLTTFTFPDQEKEISRWFEKLSAVH
ncbi:MAG: anti-sigma factor [Planifilum fimeticola]